MRRITETFRVYEFKRVIEIDDDRPSLAAPAANVYTTEGEEVTQTRGPGIAKVRRVRRLASGER